jgi:hypothetical protein
MRAPRQDGRRERHFRVCFVRLVRATSRARLHREKRGSDMPEETVVRGINWKETFPFTLIFRSFRIAIHPSKLVLALLALLTIYVGGRVLDAVWPASYNGVPEEVGGYQMSLSSPNPTARFNAERKQIRDELERRYNDRLKAIGKPEGDLDDIKYNIVQERDRQAAALRDEFTKANKPNADVERTLADARDQRILGIYRGAYDEWQSYKAVRGVGLFRLFYQYELGQVNMIVRAAREWNWMGPQGVFDGIFNFFIVGPSWAVRHHWVYFTLFGIFFLIVWAVFGGAIARIAAVHVARDEKISIRQALAFSSSKFLSFVSAPIIPLIIVLVVGLVVAIGGLIGNIPFLGPIVVGALFFLALAAGFVMTLVLLGLAGGFNLMYPTIAVEGSDSFDAISRSFSYLYARPWRLAFYTAVAVLYGALTYTFVRFFVYLLLYLTHTFVGLLFFRSADSTAPLWATMWPNPVVNQRLVYDVDFLTLSFAQDVGAGLLSFWVYITIGMLGAFAISFYFSANTIIYYLMRNEVDATELDDVYVEQSEDEFPEGGAPGVSSATSPAPVGAAPVAGADVPGSPAAPEAAPDVVPNSPPPDEQRQPPV